MSLKIAKSDDVSLHILLHNIRFGGACAAKLTIGAIYLKDLQIFSQRLVREFESPWQIGDRQPRDRRVEQRSLCWRMPPRMCASKHLSPLTRSKWRLRYRSCAFYNLVSFLSPFFSVLRHWGPSLDHFLLGSFICTKPGDFSSLSSILGDLDAMQKCTHKQKFPLKLRLKQESL